MKNSHLNHQSQQGRHLEVERRGQKGKKKDDDWLVKMFD